MFKEYLNLSTRHPVTAQVDMTIVSVVGLVGVLLLNLVVG